MLLAPLGLRIGDNRSLCEMYLTNAAQSLLQQWAIVCRIKQILQSLQLSALSPPPIAQITARLQGNLRGKLDMLGMQGTDASAGCGSPKPAHKSPCLLQRPSTVQQGSNCEQPPPVPLTLGK